MTNYPEGRGEYPEHDPQAGAQGSYQGMPPGQSGDPSYGNQGYQQTSQFPPHQGGGGWTGGPPHHRPNISVKSALKTTEFWVFVVVSLALLIAAAVSDSGDDGFGFGPQEAWKYVTALAVAYIISRGLTKFGGREENDDRHRSGRG